MGIVGGHDRSLSASSWLFQLVADVARDASVERTILDKLVAEVRLGKEPDRPKQVVKEGLSEYFLFTIEGRENIEHNEPKRLVSMKVADVPLECIYKLSDREKGDYCLPIKPCPPCAEGTRCDSKTGTCRDLTAGITAGGGNDPGTAQLCPLHRVVTHPAGTAGYQNCLASRIANVKDTTMGSHYRNAYTGTHIETRIIG